MSEALLPQESFAALFGHKQFLNMYMNVNYSKVFIALLHSILMAKIPREPVKNVLGEFVR